MADIAASVLARLKNKAHETGRSYQLCMQLFCQEEFLRRLERSRYSDNIILKGGLFIYSITDFDSRVTSDIDFLLQKIPNSPENISQMIEEIIKSPTENNFIRFELREVVPISVKKRYAGAQASLIAWIKNTRTPFTIDFGIGDIIVPNPQRTVLPTQLSEFPSPKVYTYSLQTTVAEKLDAILDLMEFSSRMKDYYDIYYLSLKFDFDGQTLAEALRKTFSNRMHNFNSERYEKVLTFSGIDSMQKKWSAFARKIGIGKTEFSQIITSIDDFLSEPYDAAINNSDFCKKWSAQSSQWE